jgi:guanylate kinase
MMGESPVSRKGILVVLSAPSGAGKTSLCRAAVRQLSKLTHSVSYTTRLPRTGEEHGRDYFFVDKAEFDRMVEAGEFLEWAPVHGNYYGTSRRVVREILESGSDVILDVDAGGAQELMAQKELEAVFVFVVTPSFAELEKRLRGRASDAEEEIRLRLKQAREEISQFRKYHYLLINDDFETALQDLLSILGAERQSVKRVESLWIEKEFLGK